MKFNTQNSFPQPQPSIANRGHSIEIESICCALAPLNSLHFRGRWTRNSFATTKMHTIPLRQNDFPQSITSTNAAEKHAHLATAEFARCIFPMKTKSKYEGNAELKCDRARRTLLHCCNDIVSGSRAFLSSVWLCPEGRGTDSATKTTNII